MSIKYDLYAAALNPTERLPCPHGRGPVLNWHIYVYHPKEIDVKLGHFILDLNVKMGYYKFMFRSLLSFALRISLIATIWVFVWKFMEPRTQLMRILRAALLVLGLLAVLAVMRITGQ